MREQDFRFDETREAIHGGQKVAVRVTHVPSGLCTSAVARTAQDAKVNAMSFLMQQVANLYIGWWIRSSHPAAFRSGEWGRITAVVPVRGRPCYRIEWKDERMVSQPVDYWTCWDPAADYELKEDQE